MKKLSTIREEADVFSNGNKIVTVTCKETGVIRLLQGAGIGKLGSTRKQRRKRK